MSRSLVLIDGHAHIYQAFYAIRGLTAPDGRPINAVFGFAGMLNKILRRNPSRVIVARDAGRKTFRNDLFEDYKATRKPMPEELVGQLPLIDRLIEAYGIPVVYKEGYEADDVIATLARQAEAVGYDEVLILTTDKDAQQLLSDHIKIYDNRKDRTLDVDALKAEKGIAPQQVVELMGLSGDTSDNVPGVPGVGPKTAEKLIQDYGTIEEVLKHVEDVPGRKLQENLKKFADQALLSRKLVTLDDRVPLEVNVDELPPQKPDTRKLLALFREWGFKRFQEELLEQAPERKTDYRMVNTPALFDNFLERLKKQKRFSVDLETTSLFPRDADIVGIAFSWEADSGDYLVLRCPPLDRRLSEKDVLAKLKPILEDASIRKVGQNLKYDAIVLLNVGIDLAGIEFDTMVASYLLNPGRRRHNLDDLAMELLNHKTIPIESLIGKGKKQIGMADVPAQDVCPYACEDADVAWRLAEALEPQLHDAELADLYNTLEVPLIDVLRDMEWAGVAVNVNLLNALGVEMQKRIDDLRAQIFEAAGEEFNLDSTQQMGVVLFDKLGLPVQKKTKTGYSTDQEVLETLQSLHALPRLVLEYRQLTKLKGTYVDALPQLVSPRTGRIHASFNQTVTATGRLSSSDPNLQNIPVRTEEGGRIREAFIPGSDNAVLLSADYSQIELRILAHYTADPELIAAFERGEDIHAFVAAQIHGLKPGDVGAEMRRQAKAVNFGIMYGLSPFGLARQLGISQQEAAAFIDAYYEKYESVPRFFEKILSECRRNGYVTTILGRRRYLQGIKDPSSRNRNQSERMAINTVCQGSAADLIKTAMVNIRRAMLERKMKSRLILQIHDELVFDVPHDEVDALTKLVRDLMMNAIPMKVPLVVNIATGKNWLEAK